MIWVKSRIAVLLRVFAPGQKKTDWVVEHPIGSELSPAVSGAGKSQALIT